MTHHPLLNDIKKNTAPLVLDGFHNLQPELIGKTLATSGRRVRLALVLGRWLRWRQQPSPPLGLSAATDRCHHNHFHSANSQREDNWTANSEGCILMSKCNAYNTISYLLAYLCEIRTTLHVCDQGR